MFTLQEQDQKKEIAYSNQMFTTFYLSVVYEQTALFKR